MAGAGCATMAWLGLYGFAWNDYDTEARPAFDALVHGHVHEFLRLAPAYGGTFVERAPFALVPGLWGGGPLAVYRMVALPCLLACAALAVWLIARMRAEARSHARSRADASRLCVANPLTLRALELGHPEELLGACLCVAAVLLAAGPSTGRDAVRSGPGCCSGWRSPTRSGHCSRPDRCCWPFPEAAGCGAWQPLAWSLQPRSRPLVLVGSGGFVAGTRTRRHGAVGDLPAVAGVVVLRPPRRRSCTACSARPSPATAQRLVLGGQDQPPADPR